MIGIRNTIKIVESSDPVTLADEVNTLTKDGWSIDEEGGMVKTKRGDRIDVRTDAYYVVLYRGEPR